MLSILITPFLNYLYITWVYYLCQYYLKFIFGLKIYYLTFEIQAVTYWHIWLKRDFNFMAGIKGRSGRYKAYRPQDINELGRLSLGVMLQFLQSKDIPLIERARIACPLVAKRIPDKIEVTGVIATLKADIADRLISLFQSHTITYDTPSLLPQGLQANDDSSSKP